MKCSKAKSLISPYVDGELDLGLKQALESHMDSCGTCRGEFEGALKLHDLLGQAESFKAPYGFSTRAMAGAAADKTGGRVWRPIFARFAEALVVLAMVAAGIVSGGFLINGLGPETRGITSSFSLEIFEPVPPGSVGSAYLAMTEVGHER